MQWRAKVLCAVVLSALACSGAWADITSNLQAYWSFSENAGTTAADSSGNSNTGTLSGSTLPSWTSTNCGAAPCLSFNGTTAYVTVASSATTNITTGDFTLAVRVYPTTVNSAYHMIISKANAATLPSYELMMSSANLFSFRQEWSGGSVAISSDTTITVNTSYCVVATATRAGTNKLYVNGTLQVYTPAGDATTLTNTYPVTIGSKQNGAGSQDYWPGTIDEVRIYGRALSQADVTEYCAFTGAVAGKRSPLLY